MGHPNPFNGRFGWHCAWLFLLWSAAASSGCCPIRAFSPQPYSVSRPPGHAAPAAQAPQHAVEAANTPSSGPAAPPPTDAALKAVPVSIEDLRTQAQQAWLQRESRPALERAIAAWDQASAREPNDLATATALARACYFLADGTLRTQDDSEATLHAYEKGSAAGERAMLTYPAFATRFRAGDRMEDAVAQIPAAGQPAMYWYASNLGRYSLAKGFSATLLSKDRLQAVMQRVLAIDETFYYGAPHRYFGAYFAKVPSFAGGDLNKARDHFEKALRINSAFFGTKVLYAELYAIRADDRALFVRLLSEVRDGDPTQLPDVIPEQRVEQDKAKKLLAQVNELF